MGYLGSQETEGWSHGFYTISACSITECSAWNSAATSCSDNHGTLICYQHLFQLFWHSVGVFPSLCLSHSPFRCIRPCGESRTVMAFGEWLLRSTAKLVMQESLSHVPISTCWPCAFLMARTLSNVTSWYLTRVWLFCDPMDCSPPGSSVHGISQARTLEEVATSSSRGSSKLRD